MSRKKGMLGRRFKAVSAAMIMGLLAAVFVAAPTTAQEVEVEPAPEESPIEFGGGGGTDASVGGGGEGTAPYIECTWALTDNNSFAPGIQWGQDDDPLTRPAEVPCTADGDESAKQPVIGDYTHIQVAPNPDDFPEQRRIELWAGIDSTNHPGTIVYWDVYHNAHHPDELPAEDFKVQVDGTSLGDDRCIVPGGAPALATIATGQATTAAMANMYLECTTQHKEMYYGAFNLSKHQPWGVYTIVLTAELAGGGESQMTFYIDVLPFVNLEKDFESVGFGSIQQNNHYTQICPGDYVLYDFSNNTPACDANGGNESSIKNTGNAGMRVAVSFRHMCDVDEASCSNLKRIDLFDSGMSIAPIGLPGNRIGVCAQGQDPNECGLASTAEGTPPLLHPFPINRYSLLCPNDEAKIEFSIYVENISNGTYEGNFGLWAIPDHEVDGFGEGRYYCPTDGWYVDNGGAVYPRAYSGGTQTGDRAPATDAFVGYYDVS